MKNYHVEGFGNEVRAIGIREHFCLNIKAENEKEAFEKLYKHREHITFFRSSDLQFQQQPSTL